jgi:AcrR family transcriptional regulator
MKENGKKESAKDSLKQALKNLVESKSYEKITVAELCKHANVSRRAFYNNCEDIDNVVDILVYEDFVEPLRAIRELLPVAKIKSSAILMQEGSARTLYENRAFYKAVMDYKGKNSLFQTFIKYFWALNAEIYESDLGDTEENQFVSYYFAWTPIITLLWWNEYEGQTDPETLAKYIDKWGFASWNALRKTKFDS